jgi:hypothetical protein
MRQSRKPYEPPPLRAYELQHREKALLSLLEKYNGHLIRNLAKQQDARWCYGMLYLIGVINHEQYQAVKRLEQETKVYESMLVRHGIVKGSNYQKTSGSSAEDLSKSAQKKMKKAKERYEGVYGVLKDCGDEIHKAVVDTLRNDRVSNIDLIRRGLTAISLWYSMEK